MVVSRLEHVYITRMLMYHKYNSHSSIPYRIYNKHIQHYNKNRQKKTRTDIYASTSFWMHVELSDTLFCGFLLLMKLSMLLFIIFRSQQILLVSSSTIHPRTVAEIAHAIVPMETLDGLSYVTPIRSAMMLSRAKQWHGVRFKQKKCFYSLERPES